MKTLSKIAAVLFIAVASMALPTQAAEEQGMLQARVKVALNDMVQDVKSANSPAEKRAVLNQFVTKLENRAALAENIPFLSEDNHAALEMLQGKFHGYKAELQGTGVGENDLDAFALFVQQDLEQAEASWGNGGIYLSTGAVIIILLILLLIT